MSVAAPLVSETKALPFRLSAMAVSAGAPVLTKIKSDSAEVAYNAGLLEQKAGRHEEAAAYYRKAAELDPQLAEAHLNLAVALQALGKPDEAVGRFEQAIRIKPSLAKGYFALKPMRRNAGQATPA